MFVKGNCIATVRDHYGHTRGIWKSLCQVMEGRIVPDHLELYTFQFGLLQIYSSI
jgi:hypothetical protein